MIPTKFNKLQLEINTNYSVDWNDFGKYNNNVGIDYQISKKYEKYKVQYASAYCKQNEAYSLSIESLHLTNNKWSQAKLFDEYFGISNTNNYSSGNRCYPFYVGQDINDANWIQNGFYIENNNWYSKSGNCKCLSFFENNTTFKIRDTDPDYNFDLAGILLFRLIDPNGIIYMPSNYAYYTCLTQDAMIMMFDGSQKMIKDIQIGDKILGINPQTEKFQQDQVTIVSKYQDVYSESCDIWYFENGTIIKTPKWHRFFNINLQKFQGLENWNIGDQIRLYDGSSPKLIKHQIKYEKTKCYTLFSKFNSYIANKCICGNRFSKPITPFDK